MTTDASTSEPPSCAWPVLALFLALCFGVSALAGLWTGAETSVPGGWFAGLAKPSWNPPGWVFAPVWTFLYAAMAVAAWLVWRDGQGAARRRALAAFAVQLALNLAWSGLFFGLRRPDLAALEIVALLVAILVTIATFRPVSRPAAWLLAPYAAWVSFATALNVAIWQMNA